MRQQNSIQKPILLCFVTIVLFTVNAFCAPPDSSYKHALPAMWIQKTDAQIDHYKQNRKKTMETEYKGQPDCFLLKGWTNLINYLKFRHPLYTCLRAYLCAYTPGSGIQPAQNNKLVIVFVPTIVIDENHSQELGYYYIPDNDSFTVAHITRFTIKQSDLQNWSHNYADHCLNHLSKDIDDTDPQNQNRTGAYTDTWCMAYCRPLIEELAKERTYIHTNKTNTKRIRISQNVLFSLATFPDITGSQPKKSGRLFFSLDFTDYKGKRVFLDDMYGFSQRDTTTAQCDACGGHHMLDNGQLCPPAANCPLK